MAGGSGGGAAAVADEDGGRFFHTRIRMLLSVGSGRVHHGVSLFMG